MNCYLSGLILQQILGVIPYNGRWNVKLIVGNIVHKYPVISVAVEILHVPAINICRLNLHTRVECAIHNLAREHVLELASHKGATFSRLDMLEINDSPQLAIDIEHHTVLKVVAGRHVFALSVAGDHPDRRILVHVSETITALTWGQRDALTIYWF